MESAGFIPQELELLAALFARSMRQGAPVAGRTSRVLTFSTSKEVRSIQSALFALAWVRGSETTKTTDGVPACAGTTAGIRCFTYSQDDE